MSTQQDFLALRAHLQQIIVGQHDLLDRLLIALLTGGHLLLEGPPGLAKTTAVNALAGGVHASFQRVQFTPDLMPGDLTGSEIFDPEQHAFRFVPGPLFHEIVLADEINRAPPKVQSALLEAMAEHQITVGGVTRDLPELFVVMATQNPLEQSGTYPLPEAQLDRFMFLIRMAYPQRAEEMQILRQTTTNREVTLTRQVDGATLLDVQRCVRDIPVSEHVLGYCIDLVRNTRPAETSAPEFVRANLAYGAGPRAGQYLVLAAKATAALDGRLNVCCADVRRNAHAVLGHRIACNFHATGEGIDATQIIDRLLHHVPEPDSAGA